MAKNKRKNAPYIDRDAYVTSYDKTSEALIEMDVDDHSKVVIVPMDDCIIEVVWSHEHERLVGVVREIPGRD